MHAAEVALISYRQHRQTISRLIEGQRVLCRAMIKSLTRQLIFKAEKT